MGCLKYINSTLHHSIPWLKNSEYARIDSLCLWCGSTHTKGHHVSIFLSKRPTISPTFSVAIFWTRFLRYCGTLTVSNDSTGQGLKINSDVMIHDDPLNNQALARLEFHPLVWFFLKLRVVRFHWSLEPHKEIPPGSYPMKFWMVMVETVDSHKVASSHNLQQRVISSLPTYTTLNKQVFFSQVILEICKCSI